MILLVEDNADDVKLTLRAFKKLNFTSEVIVARDGAEALDFIFGRGTYQDRDTSLKPSVILLDLKLPKVNGLEVLKKVKSEENTRSIPVVMLTTSEEDRDVKESYQLGVNSYIRKPVQYECFNDALKQLGTYWLSLNKAPA